MVEYNNSMKKIIVLLVALFAVIYSFALEKAPFRKGVNLSNWFEAWNPGSANYKMFDKTDFVQLKKLGADVVRVPIHFENLSSGKNKYIVNPIVWKYLDQAFDWARISSLRICAEQGPVPGKILIDEIKIVSGI